MSIHPMSLCRRFAIALLLSSASLLLLPCNAKSQFLTQQPSVITPGIQTYNSAGGSSYGGYGYGSTATTGQNNLGTSTLNTPYSGQGLLTTPVTSGYGNSGYGNGGIGSSTGTNGNQGYSVVAQPNSNSAASQQGGAPALEPAPIAGAPEKTKDKLAKDLKGANGIAASPALAAVQVLAIGDVLHGAVRAITGDSISMDGHTITLQGIKAPAVDALCHRGATTWRCGEDSRDALQRVSSEQPVQCTLTALSPSAVALCMIGNENLSALVVDEGAAFATDPALRGRMAIARADQRGIWD